MSDTSPSTRLSVQYDSRWSAWSELTPPDPTSCTASALSRTLIRPICPVQLYSKDIRGFLTSDIYPPLD